MNAKRVLTAWAHALQRCFAERVTENLVEPAWQMQLSTNLGEHGAERSHQQHSQGGRSGDDAKEQFRLQHRSHAGPSAVWIFVAVDAREDPCGGEFEAAKNLRCRPQQRDEAHDAQPRSVLDDDLEVFCK